MFDCQRVFGLVLEIVVSSYNGCVQKLIFHSKMLCATLGMMIASEMGTADVILVYLGKIWQNSSVLCHKVAGHDDHLMGRRSGDHPRTCEYVSNVGSANMFIIYSKQNMGKYNMGNYGKIWKNYGNMFISLVIVFPYFPIQLSARVQKPMIGIHPNVC